MENWETALTLEEYRPRDYGNSVMSTNLFFFSLSYLYSEKCTNPHSPLVQGELRRKGTEADLARSASSTLTPSHGNSWILVLTLALGPLDTSHGPFVPCL